MEVKLKGRQKAGKRVRVEWSVEWKCWVARIFSQEDSSSTAPVWALKAAWPKEMTPGSWLRLDKYIVLSPMYFLTISCPSNSFSFMLVFHIRRNKLLFLPTHFFLWKGKWRNEERRQLLRNKGLTGRLKLHWNANHLGEGIHGYRRRTPESTLVLWAACSWQLSCLHVPARCPGPSSFFLWQNVYLFVSDVSYLFFIIYNCNLAFLSFTRHIAGHPKCL